MRDQLRVLLTGAGGFVGHHTLAHLLKTTDWTIVLTDSFRHMGTSARLRSVFLDFPELIHRVKTVTHDLTTPFDSVTVKEIGEVDIIINMASESSVDQSILNPRNFVENNVNLQLTMLEFARNQKNLRLFVQISTDEVYGPAPHGTEHGEWEAIVPSNPYSASKAAQESLSISYWRTYGIPVLITNTMNIIGERQDVEKFVPLCINRILSGSKVPVHASLQNGKWVSGSRFYLHARNQADALKFLIETFAHRPNRYLSGDARPLRFNVKGEVEKSNDEMVNLVAKFLNKGGHDWVEYVNVEGARPGHDLRYALNGEALHSLGWKPPVSFEDSLQRTVEWTSKHPEWLTSR
jgi:dTDP-glucose 4,6-dehydratase